MSRAAKYGRVPISVLFCTAADACGGDDARLYAYLTTFDFKFTHEAWPGRELAAEKLGWSLRKLDGHLARLAHHRHIQRRQAGAGGVARVELLADVVHATALQDPAALQSEGLSPARSGKRTSYRTRNERSEDDVQRKARELEELQRARELEFERNERQRAEGERQLELEGGVASMPPVVRDGLRRAS